jgi:hypothetical protein
VVLPLAVPQPAALDRAAGREPAADEPHRASTREPDVDAALGREIGAGRHDPVARDQLERVVDGETLDDAVQIEQQPRRSRDEPARHAHGAPRAAIRGRGRLGRGHELVEVGVVAGRDDRRAERRVDEPVGRPRGGERAFEHRRELRGDDDDGAAGGVHAVELAAAHEPAEALLPRAEERLDPPQLDGGRAGDRDLAAHRAEAVHELPVESCGACCAGASAPPSSPDWKKPEPSCAAVADDELDEDLVWPGCEARSRTTAPRNAATAATAMPVFADAARARASAIRDMSPWKRLRL